MMGRDIDTFSDKALSTTIGVVLTEKCDIRNMSVRELVGMGRQSYTGFWDVWIKRTKDCRRIHFISPYRKPCLPHGTYPF